MLRSVRTLNNLTIGARDGEIGQVSDILFDDVHWTVRYLVVNTGGWLTGGQVLISPIAVRSIGWQSEVIMVDLTRQQVKKSPEIATDPPLSHQMEAQYASYYQYPPYWEGTGLWGAGMYPRPLLMHTATGSPPTPPPPADEGSAQPDATSEQRDRHLRSAREIIGYQIAANDGTLGNVDDFLLDDETWALRYLVVDTGTWWPGKSVLVAPGWVGAFDWSASRVLVDLDRDVIKQAPKFDPSRPVGRQFEEALHTYYGQPPYWTAEHRAYVSNGS